MSQPGHTPASRDNPLQVIRDAEWLAGTCSGYAEVLCAVLDGSQEPAMTLWREKVSVRRNSWAAVPPCVGKSLINVT